MSHPSVPQLYVSFIEVCCLRVSLVPKISNGNLLYDTQYNFR